MTETVRRTARGGADDVPVLAVGALTMACMGIGLVMSRTTGLPGFHESGWELSGVVCLVLEAAFVAVAAGALGAGSGRTAAA